MKILLIDVDDTLLDFSLCTRASVKGACETTGIPFSDELVQTFLVINDGLWKMAERGEIEREELLRIRWGMVFEKLGIVGDGVAYEAEFFRNLYDSHEPVEGALDFLRSVYGHYTLCAASNGPYDQQVSRLQKAGMYGYFDHLFVSERIGCGKPSKGFFDAVMRELGDPPRENVMMIGDSPTADIAGSVSYGIKTCWLRRDASMICDPAPDYTVDSLKEIEKILK